MKKLILSLALMACASLAANAQSAVADDIYSDDNAGSEVQLSVVTPAQQKQETKAERKAREKRNKELVDSIAHLKAVQALEQGYYVLLADHVSMPRSGYVVSGLSNNSNFLLRQGDGGIFQVAFNNGRMGFNGLGGITLNGKVSGVRLRQGKKGDATITYNMIGTQMNANVQITVYEKSNRASAYVTPNLGTGSITLEGTLVPYRNKGIRIDY